MHPSVLPILLAAAALAACADPIRAADPSTVPLGRDAPSGALTPSGADAAPGREPLLPSAGRPSLGGGTVLQGAPGTPTAPLSGSGTGLF